MENGIKGSRIWYNLRQRGGYARAVLARLPPPHPTPAQGCCEILFCVISRNFHEIFNFCFAKFSSNFAKNKIILSKFCVSRNFDKIIFNLAKLEKNLAKHKIKNFAKLGKRKFCSNPTPTQSAICYSPSPSVCQKILQCGAAMLL